NAARVVFAAAAHDRAHMNDRHAELARGIVKSIDRRNDVARAGRRTRAVRRVVEMAAMHVDRYDRGLSRIEIVFKAVPGILGLVVDIDAHLFLRIFLTSPRALSPPVLPDLMLRASRAGAA